MSAPRSISLSLDTPDTPSGDTPSGANSAGLEGLRYSRRSALPEAAQARPTLLDFAPSDLESLAVEAGHQRFRGRQLFHWLHARGARTADAMSNMPRRLREDLGSRFSLFPAEVVRGLRSADGLTQKLLVRFADGEMVESVIMDSPAVGEKRARRTVCISTQAGCAMACTFCATGQMGFTRQLSAGEIVSQVYLGREPAAQPVTNVVFMGMGEPLANYEQTLKAVWLLSAPDGLNLSARGITISTVGLAPQIRRLAGEGLALNLAISLHAPNDELRGSMMPVNRRWPIAEVLAAGDEFAARTGRRVSYEYVLIRDSNDSPECARELAALLGGRLCHVNLIPLNPTADPGLRASESQRTQLFRRIVQDAGVPCTVRVNRGRDIDAACGQLRLRAEELPARPQRRARGV